MLRILEYIIVALVAVVFSIGMIVLWEYLRDSLGLGGGGGNIEYERPEVRAELAEKCDQQFRGRTPPATATARNWDEYNLRYAPDERAYVLVRVRGGYYSFGTSSSYGSSSSANETKRRLEGVNLHVVHPENPYRNSATCAEDFSYNAKDGLYEAWCSWRPDPDRPERNDFRIFVTNDTDSDVEYCMVTNCASEAWTGGAACEKP